MRRKTGFGIVALLAGVFCLSPLALAAPPGSWTTDYTLFNVGSGPATFSMMRYPLCSGSGCAADAGTDFSPAAPGNVIAAGGSYYYNPANDSTFPTGFSGSVVVSSSEALAGTVTLGNGLTGSAYASDAYSAVTTPAPSVIGPIIMAGVSGVWYTRISIQNTGTANANVNVAYVGAGAPAAQDITGLPPNMTAWVDQADLGAINFNGAVKITSAQPLAVVVEEYKTSGGVLVSYNGLPSTDAGTTVYLPGYIDQGAWATDFTLVETSGVASNVTVAFAGSAATITGPVPANGSVYLNRYGSFPAGWSGTFPTGYYGGATITGVGGALVAVYNISNSGTGGAGNLAVGYTGFAAAKAKQQVVVPLIENAYSSGWVTTYTVQSVNGSPATLTLTYNGNLAPNASCNPNCTVTMGAAAQTFNQGSDGHIPAGFLGGVKINSTANIVVIADQQNVNLAGDTAAGFVGM
jgi:hypothetical protein